MKRRRVGRAARVSGASYRPDGDDTTELGHAGEITRRCAAPHLQLEVRCRALKKHTTGVVLELPRGPGSSRSRPPEGDAGRPYLLRQTGGGLAAAIRQRIGNCVLLVYPAECTWLRSVGCRGFGDAAHVRGVVRATHA